MYLIYSFQLNDTVKFLRTGSTRTCELSVKKVAFLSCLMKYVRFYLQLVLALLAAQQYSMLLYSLKVFWGCWLQILRVFLQLHNKNEDLKGKIRVYVRVRPFSTKERDRGCKEAVEAQGKQTIAVEDPRVKEDKTFEFDQVGSVVC